MNTYEVNAFGRVQTVVADHFEVSDGGAASFFDDKDKRTHFFTGVVSVNLLPGPALTVLNTAGQPAAVPVIGINQGEPAAPPANVASPS